MSARPSIDAVLSGQAVLVSTQFEAKVSRTDGCWLWTGRLNSTGYGRFSQKAKWVNAHRFAFEWLHGPLPKSVYVCHKCDVRHCVRPDHLFAGTAADNNRDMWEKGRGVANGMPLPGESNPQAVLTENDVRLIRKLVAADCPQKAVAAAFGVSPSAVSDIVRGRRWAGEAASA